MPRPRVHDDEVRARLIDAAAAVLAAEGPHAVTTRRVAREVGTSTTAIYSLLGSKQEMFRAMYVEGFQRLADRQRALPVTDDPLADLRAMGRTYFENGLANPHLYDVMFHRPVQDFAPEEEDVAFALSTLQDLVAVVERAVGAGRLHGDAAEIGTDLWAMVHGVTSLTIAGMLDPDSAPEHLDRMMAAAVAGYAAPA